MWILKCSTISVRGFLQRRSNQERGENSPVLNSTWVNVLLPKDTSLNACGKQDRYHNHTRIALELCFKLLGSSGIRCATSSSSLAIPFLLTIRPCPSALL
ncbi:hypothetical protein G7K_0784-t1 [Saitoella complicata NRRL Y-17804]|uniref:Uncharacterized protein n=1 Tax=Saitoella complicata (strain BCRC 22490 / CBS 7301 / JCM 7358 / NBRC 10748 / NRRL Y-17804) TaxID=698492 RepID=A0A0E9N9Q2_SAICN|nr:hypothetical protein G7K_0784-t1 [Saitoella complicata NRRL Y-17804]